MLITGSVTKTQSQNCYPRQLQERIWFIYLGTHIKIFGGLLDLQRLELTHFWVHQVQVSNEESFITNLRVERFYRVHDLYLYLLPNSSLVIPQLPTWPHNITKCTLVHYLLLCTMLQNGTFPMMLPLRMRYAHWSTSVQFRCSSDVALS